VSSDFNPLHSGPYALWKELVNAGSFFPYLYGLFMGLKPRPLGRRILLKRRRRFLPLEGEALPFYGEEGVTFAALAF